MVIKTISYNNSNSGFPRSDLISKTDDTGYNYLRKLAIILPMVDGLGIISMTRVFESYGIEPYIYFVQENLQVNFTNDFG